MVALVRLHLGDDLVDAGVAFERGGVELDPGADMVDSTETVLGVLQGHPAHNAVDFGRDDVDAAIQYGSEVGPEFVGQRLFDEVLVPVCSATVAAQQPVLRRPRDVIRHVLLHSIRRPNDWPDWFAGAGVDDPPLDKSMAFENSTLTYQGAVDGLGVAIAQVAFVIDEIDRGRLVAPIDVRLPSELGYFLVIPREKAQLRKLRLFDEWAAAEAATTRAAMG